MEELGAAFLCADLGITAEPRPDHAAQIDQWMHIRKGDKKAIFTAASVSGGGRICSLTHQVRRRLKAAGKLYRLSRVMASIMARLLFQFGSIHEGGQATGFA